ncbi:MAG: hypothetical protein WBO46_15045 [Caldilineaceae bacterium]
MSRTVVLRLVGAATLVGQPQQPGEAQVNACVGGYGREVADIARAARLLLENRAVRIDAADEQAVREEMAAQALAGNGPDGQGAFPAREKRRM